DPGVLAGANLIVTAGTIYDMTGGSNTANSVSLRGGAIVDSVGGGVLSSTTAFDLQAGSVSGILGGTAGATKTTTSTITITTAPAPSRSPRTSPRWAVRSR